ncbi:U3 snoRNP protein [Xylographa opegraphella]|nr:U3 snoRNP protein [Xylographa opegraphella]
MAPGRLSSPPLSPRPVAAYIHPSAGDLHPSSDQLLLSTLSDFPHSFLQPPPTLHTAALVLAKRYLDSLASSTSQAQEQRLQDARRKRKRAKDDEGNAKNILRLKQVHLEGFAIDQIWEQARRVLDASREEIERSLSDLSDVLPTVTKASNDSKKDVPQENVKMVRFDEDGFEIADEDGSNEESEGDLELEDASDAVNNLDNTELVEKLLDGGELDDEDEDEKGEDVDDEEDIEQGDSDLEMNEIEEAETEIFKPDKHGLNDGFFSIDEFNRNSEFLEQQGARSDPNDGDASDEEEIDWDADPMTTTNGTRKRTDGNDSDESSEDEGPTFGNADLNAPFSDSDTSSELDTALEDTTLSNTNAIKYEDFFAPPPLPTKKRTQRPLPKTQPPPTEDDIQHTISAVRRELFEDEPSPLPSEAEDAPNTSSTANNNLSTHQKRQAALASQIRALEAANVAKRDWTLAGEARAAERPLNSLLEEDLDFERAGKPVPVITAAVSEDIEALIKRRILARQFDEVLRRRPDSLRSAPGGEAVRRGRIELDDAKSKVGLGELYAEEHLRNVDPEGFVDTRDAAVGKAHAEIERLWGEVSAKLDALSSWHYRPKPAEVVVRVLGDVPAVRMEDARPSGVGGIGAGEGASMLAPQEVYAGGEGAEKGEVVRGGAVVGREEMTREEKLRRRRREKERGRKMEGKRSEGGKKGGEVAKVVEGKRKTGEKEVVAELKRGGVKVIGKKGEVRDVEGKMVKGGESSRGGGDFKL